MHGGLSPQLMDLSQIRNIPRPIDVPDSGLVCDLLWGDPDEVSPPVLFISHLNIRCELQSRHPIPSRTHIIRNSYLFCRENKFNDVI